MYNEGIDGKDSISQAVCYRQVSGGNSPDKDYSLKCEYAGGD